MSRHDRPGASDEGGPGDTPRIDELVRRPDGRRQLRQRAGLDRELANRLLRYPEDFAVKRRDRTLDAVVEAASLEALIEQRHAVLSGPAAGTFLRRIGQETDRLTEIAEEVARSGQAEAAGAVIGILLLDPVESFDLDATERVSIAVAALDSPEGSVRGLAAEFLNEHRPEELAERIERLAADADPRARAFAWTAAFRLNAGPSFDLVVAILGDESLPLWQRRSALIAAGERLPTGEVADLLAYFVQHPDETLAMDAASLFFTYHRTPVVAEAAIMSPHERVQEIGQRLMDPLRGSPAAGGSRPGDPTGGDAFAEMLRRLGEESGA